MKEIVLTSTNEAKKRAALSVIFELLGAGNVLRVINTPSGVRPTPVSHEECITGAKNRIIHAKEHHAGADLYIGAEGGLHHMSDRWFIGGWVVAEDKSGTQHLGSSAWVELPDFLSSRIDPELPFADLIKSSDFPQPLYDRRDVLGTNGLITRGVYSRVNEFSDALKVALALFKFD